MENYHEADYIYSFDLEKDLINYLINFLEYSTESKMNNLDIAKMIKHFEHEIEALGLSNQLLHFQMMLNVKGITYDTPLDEIALMKK